MSALVDILSGQLVLENAESKINGRLTVIRDLTWGTYIKGGGLPQSGGLAEKIWNISLRELSKKKVEVKSVLVLGLGGGGLVKDVRSHWPKSKITGVDIDPVIVELGKKYLNLNSYKVNVLIKDAEDFVKESIKKGDEYDLICVDTYLGDEFPEKFENETFLKNIRKLLDDDGHVIFNRLYGSTDRKNANKMGDKLESIFTEVDRVYPVANVMFVCKK